MNNLAIITARGGSKRLPGKNIKLLNGKPLIHYTLEAVVSSGIYQTVLFSSDDDKILEIASQIKGVTIEKRDASFAGDKVKVIDLIKDIGKRPGYEEKYDTISLFLPTCPFRTAKHIREGFQLLTPQDYSVISCNEMNDPVQLTLTMDGENIIDPHAIIDPSPLVTGNTRSQDFKTVYRANGGFYIAWLKKFNQSANFFSGDRVKGYVMPSIHAVDVDYELDFKWAEYLLQNGHISL
jgi:CMP-N,N'-diacetyllegionaminic acid synthase